MILDNEEYNDKFSIAEKLATKISKGDKSDKTTTMYLVVMKDLEEYSLKNKK